MLDIIIVMGIPIAISIIAVVIFNTIRLSDMKDRYKRLESEYHSTRKLCTSMNIELTKLSESLDNHKHGRTHAVTKSGLYITSFKRDGEPLFTPITTGSYLSVGIVKPSLFTEERASELAEKYGATAVEKGKVEYDSRVVQF